MSSQDFDEMLSLESSWSNFLHTTIWERQRCTNNLKWRGKTKKSRSCCDMFPLLKRVEHESATAKRCISVTWGSIKWQFNHTGAEWSQAAACWDLQEKNKNVRAPQRAESVVLWRVVICSARNSKLSLHILDINSALVSLCTVHFGWLYLSI